MWDPAVKLTDTLRAMQREGTFCDITLQAERKTITAHKVILVAGSPYFNAMFNGSFSEAESKVVKFEEVTFFGLKAVVDEIYCKTPAILAGNVCDILSAAHLFQMENLLSSVCDSMITYMSSENCFQFLEYAQKYELESVVDAVYQFIVDNFAKIADNEQLYGTPKYEFCNYLSLDSLQTEFHEIEVYKAAKKWLDVNNVSDSETVSEIMRNVRFGLIKSETLSEVMNDSVLADNVECCNMVRDAMNYQSNINTQPLYRGNLNKPRGMKGLFVFDSETRDRDEHNIYLIPFLKDDKPKTISVSAFPRSSWMRAVNVNNFLFVFGVIRGPQQQNFTKRYDPATDTWLDLTPMQRRTTRQWAIAHSGENIFIIGGVADDPDPEQYKTVDDVYKFCIATNSWMKCENLPEKYDGPSAAYLNGYIYCSGGKEESYRTSNKLFAFDINDGSWSDKEPMRRPRYRHILEAVGDRIYAIAGCGRLFKSSAIESYNPLKDQWTFITTNIAECMDGYTYDCITSFVFEDKIHIFGGWDIKVMEYDTKRKKVTEIVHQIPRSLSDQSFTKFCCTLMSVPKLL